MRETIAVSNVAEGYLRLLGMRGIEFIFGNGGTDFAPLIEAYGLAESAGRAAAAADCGPPRECGGCHGSWLHRHDR